MRASALERSWWLRAAAVLVAPRAVFLSLRDDGAEEREARQEPIMAIAGLAGVAGVLGTPVAARITRALAVPTIGIGAGADCDGQVLVWHDLLGLYEGHAPRFVKRYANLAPEITAALKHYVDDVRSGAFPEEQHTYKMPAEERKEFEARTTARSR